MEAPDNQENNNPERTIDDIHSEFVQSQPQEQAQPVPQQPQPQATESYRSVPDPALEPDKFANMVTQESNALKQQLSNVSSRLSQYEQESQKQTVSKAIGDAVGTVNDTVNQDPELVESYLNIRYNKDQKFAQIWDNRDKNPKALNEALGVVARDMQNKFSIKVDSQIAEDQRAINNATRSTRQNKVEDNSDDKLMKLNDAEFDVYWNKLNTSIF